DVQSRMVSGLSEGEQAALARGLMSCVRALDA
ncbi:MAG: hypothetical protein JWO10_660, partial [Microbacteriaceae bacterium]|nr:hypothetical protein [Microbacteriaceae bacterium]